MPHLAFVRMPGILPAPLLSTCLFLCSAPERSVRVGYECQMLGV